MIVEIVKYVVETAALLRLSVTVKANNSFESLSVVWTCGSLYTTENRAAHTFLVCVIRTRWSNLDSLDESLS